MPCTTDRPESPGVGPAVTQVLMLIAVLAGPFFYLHDFELQNGIRLVILFALFQASGHLSKHLYSAFAGESTVTKVFPEGKPEYTWLMSFLAEEKLYRKFRFSKAVAGGPDTLPLGKVRKLRWNKLSIEVTRTEEPLLGLSERPVQQSLLEIKIHSFDDSMMTALLDEAKSRYMNSHSTEATVHTIAPISAWGGGGAVWAHTRKMTALSLALPVAPEVMDSLTSEAMEFFNSADWYAAAGLPWKKTFLLDGVNGTNPFNVVLSLGAKLRRDIFYLDLLASDTQCTNGFLLQALSSVPSGSIFVLENIDQVYMKGAFGPSCSCCPQGPGATQNYTYSYELKPMVTPHGVLDCLRGLCREQGILLIATATNISAIPNTLFANGLIDRSVPCTLATKEQMVSLFNKFFPTSHGIPHTASADYNEYLKVPLLPDLAAEFADHIPAYTFSLVELQQYLILHKSSAAAAVAGVAKWVDEKMDAKFPPSYPVYSSYGRPMGANSWPPRAYSPAWSPSPPPPPPPPVIREDMPDRVYTPPQWHSSRARESPQYRPYSPVYSPRPVRAMTPPTVPYVPSSRSSSRSSRSRSRSPSPVPQSSCNSRSPSPAPQPRQPQGGWTSWGPPSPQIGFTRVYSPSFPNGYASPAPVVNRGAQHDADE